MKCKGKVFLLDDDQLIVTVLCRTLQKEGYEIYAETETEDIIHKIRSWNPDVVILDIRMPGRNGIDILEEIKRSEIDTRVVMLTADDSAETAAEALKLGAVDYLTKPFDINQIGPVISNVLAK